MTESSGGEILRIGATLAAAVLGVFGTVLVVHLRKTTARQKLRNALYTEVNSMEWIKEAEHTYLKEEIKSGADVPHTYVPTQIYDSKIEDIGLLSKAERKAVISYYQSAHVAESQLKRIDENEDNQSVRNAFTQRTLEELITNQRAAEKHLKARLSLGGRIATTLGRSPEDSVS